MGVRLPPVQYTIIHMGSLVANCSIQIAMYIIYIMYYIIMSLDAASTQMSLSLLLLATTAALVIKNLLL